MIETPVFHDSTKENSKSYHGIDWSILGKDKSTFLLLAILRLKDEHDLPTLTKEIPEPLHELFDGLVSFLEKNGLIEITETKLRLIDNGQLNFSVELMKNFFPSLTRAAADASLRNFAKKTPGTSLYMQAVARTPRNLALLREVDQFLVEKFKRMAVEKSELGDYSCQLICYTNCQVKVEDAL